MVVTDLDGTLLDPAGRLAAEDRATLVALGREGRLRVIATGRSLYSAERVLAPDTPIDYLVVSSGAGIVDWATRDLIRAANLAAVQVTAATDCLAGLGLDFMIHAPVPGNHRFWFHGSGADNPDFARRIERYRDYAGVWDPDRLEAGPMSQLLAVLPAWDPGRVREIVRALPDLNVIRTTSPLDGRSVWIEIFPRHVSKAIASEWIARTRGRARENVLVVGNDYNDLALLEWGGSPFVVGNAASGLVERFPAVGSNEQGGFSDAVRRWKRKEGENTGAPPDGGAPDV